MAEATLEDTTVAAPVTEYALSEKMRTYLTNLANTPKDETVHIVVLTGRECDDDTLDLEYEHEGNVFMRNAITIKFIERFMRMSFQALTSIQEIAIGTDEERADLVQSIADTAAEYKLRKK